MGFRITNRKLKGTPFTGHEGPDIRAGEHEKGYPAVTIDLNGPNHSRTFSSPFELDQFRDELLLARNWLREKVGSGTVEAIVGDGERVVLRIDRVWE